MRPLLAPAAPIIRKAVAALALLLAASGAPAATPPSAPSRAAAFDQTKLTAIDDAVARAIADRKIPGGVLWIERDGQVHRRVYGNRVLEPVSDGATEDTIYDAASLTKVIATTTAVMQLVERGRLRLDDPVSRHLPAFAQHGKEAITVRHLLTHMSGLRPGIPANPPWTGIPAAVERALSLIHI
jgi:CubicO group peptidase (beta-lactamase class C family)